MSRKCLKAVLSLSICALLLALPSGPVASASRGSIAFQDYALYFDRFEASSEGLPVAERVATFKRSFEKLRPGLYVDPDPAALDARIAAALVAFPAIRTRYRHVRHVFPRALDFAVRRFRVKFPSFRPAVPIYLAHELGIRDGGSDYVSGQKVMLFGADVIAQTHLDDSLQPFLEHELFHLEHARRFADCDQLWCPLWQEGLATYAASIMTPGASDHQLILDRPAPISGPTNARLGEALCAISDTFDSTDMDAIASAFMVRKGSTALPGRYGYYIGLLVAREAGQLHSLSKLARLDDLAARPVVVDALSKLIAKSHAPCSAPSRLGEITHVSPRPA